MDQETISEKETQFRVDDSEGRVVVHTAVNRALPKNSRMVLVAAAGRNKRSVSASISTQVHESDLGIIDFDLQSDSNEDLSEVNEEEMLIAESSEAGEPTTENEKKSEMSKSTKRVTDMAVRKFREFVKSKDLSGSFEQCTAEELDSLLYEFYSDAKKKNGKKLKVSTLRTIRSSLDRHLKTESDNCMFTIAHSPIFNKSNKVLEEVEATEMAERALEMFDESARVVKPLTADDVKTLWETGIIGTDEPKALQRLVFLIIGINFGITTRDDVRQLKPSLFLFCSDTLRGLEFVQLDELQFLPSRAKKQKGKLENKIFSIPSSPYCPVAALKSYLEKTHPQQQTFYQTPNPKFRKENIWYKREPIGKNTLGRFMRDISVDAHLPHQYVNSSLRITPPEVFSQGISAFTMGMPYPYYSCPAGLQAQPHANTVPNNHLTSSAHHKSHILQSCQQSIGVTHNPSPSPVTSSNNRIFGTPNATNTNTTFTATEGCSSDQPTPIHSQSWPTTPLSVPPFTLGTPPTAMTSVSPVSTAAPTVSIAPTKLGVAASLASLQGNCIPVQTCPVLCLPYDWEMKDVLKVLRTGEALLLTKARSANHAQPASSTNHSSLSSFYQQGDSEKFKEAIAVVNSKLGQLQNRAMQEPRVFDALLDLRQLQKNLNSFVAKVESGGL